ncbi:cell envelope integrity protein TolA [Halorhodospira halophila]|uniref:cell envelope integrity protein TolA n=1 Tax=Halorhodospira halophila TaxID=1053 RepID=UPI0019142684|nr:cell envelope integrity protein TolA [Halorhodospira halophila]
MNMQNLEFRVYYDRHTHSVLIYPVVTENGEITGYCSGLEMVWSDYQKGMQLDPEASRFRVDVDAAQELVDSLWAQGIRPKRAQQGRPAEREGKAAEANQDLKAERQRVDRLLSVIENQNAMIRELARKAGEVDREPGGSDG